jgi:hypothetical protein
MVIQLQPPSSGEDAAYSQSERDHNVPTYRYLFGRVTIGQHYSAQAKSVAMIVGVLVPLVSATTECEGKARPRFGPQCPKCTETSARRWGRMGRVSSFF